MQNIVDSVTSRLRDPQVVTLVLVLTVCTLLILFLGGPLAPVFTALVVAYLLEGMLRFLQELHLPRPMAVLIVFSIFFITLLLLLFVLLPNLIVQLTKLAGEAPRITIALKDLLDRLTAMAAGYVSPTVMNSMVNQLLETSQTMMTRSLAFLLHSLPGIMSALMYLFLVPFLVFFYLWDKDKLLAGLRRYQPHDRDLLRRVLQQAELGVGGYVRGKFWELLILWVVTYIVFVFMQVDYAFLLGLLTGLSVLIPFVGLAVATVPVLVLSLFQWGLNWDAAQPVIAYGVLQLLDAVIVAPLILGETVKVHPTSIILAVLLFGALWGLWGVFFAVPLAVLFKSIAEAIPENPERERSLAETT